MTRGRIKRKDKRLPCFYVFFFPMSFLIQETSELERGSAIDLQRTSPSGPPEEIPRAPSPRLNELKNSNGIKIGIAFIRSQTTEILVSLTSMLVKVNQRRQRKSFQNIASCEVKHANETKMNGDGNLVNGNKPALVKQTFLPTAHYNENNRDENSETQPHSVTQEQEI
jgi:hypothetical protein